MKGTVYIETSVVSYLTGRPSRDMVIAAHQELSRQWWDTRASLFEVVISELVREESSGGDAKAACRRMAKIENIPVLKISDAALALAERLVSKKLVPHNHGFQVWMFNENLSFVSSAGTAPPVVLSTNMVIPKDTWTFFAIIYDSTDDGPEAVRFYRGTTNNSVYLVSNHGKGSLGPSGNSTNCFHLGGTGANAFKGWIDDVRITDGAADRMTLEAIRLAGITRTAPPGSVPEITGQPESTTVMLGQEASFSVSAAGLPLPYYQWRYNGQPIGGNESLLQIPNAQLSNTGAYDVVVFNVYGAVTSQVAHLIVNDQPRIITDLADQHFYQGDSGNFGVELTGHPWPAIRWTRNGNPWSDEDNGTTTHVYISSVSVSDHSGAWQVTASNQFGVVHSRVATVRVIDPNAFPFTTRDAVQPAPGGGGTVLRWQSAYGRVFDVYWGTNLLGGYESFIPIATSLPPTPPMNVHTHSVHNVEAYGFYFIDVREP